MVQKCLLLQPCLLPAEAGAISHGPCGVLKVSSERGRHGLEASCALANVHATNSAPGLCSLELPALRAMVSTTLGSLRPQARARCMVKDQQPFNRPSIAHNAYVSAAGVSSSAAKATIWRPCCRCCSQPLSELPERHFSRSIELVDRSEFGNGFEELAQRLTASTSSQEPTAEPQLPLTESSRPQSGTAEEEPNPASTARAPLVQPQALPCARFASHALHLMQWQLGDIIICQLLQR